MLEQLKSGFIKTINWNKYQSKRSIERQNPYLDYLIDPNFQAANIYFVLSFEDNMVREGQIHFLLAVKLKAYNVMIHRKKLFDQSVKNDLRAYENIRRIASGQGDNYTTDYLLDYICLKNIIK